MKHARKRWLKVIATYFCLSTPIWPHSAFLSGLQAADDSPYTEASASLGEGYSSVRLGTPPLPAAEDNYASVKLGGAPPVVPPPPELDFGSAKVGKSNSASVTAQPETQIAQGPSPYALPDAVFNSTQPMFNTAPIDEGVGYASMSALDRIKWRVGRVNMDQYGINQGYTNLNAFVPLALDGDRSILWFNPRVNITDQGAGGASIGVGHRFYSPQNDRVYGSSFWWDYDPGHRGTYYQLGGSFESIGRYFSLRGNFTLPIGDTTTPYGIVNGSPQFVGNRIAVQQNFLMEKAYQQYDVEVATPVPGLGQYGLDFGLGMYYLAASSEEDTVGVSVRAQAQVTEDFWINGIYTHDDKFGSLTSINFELTMPDGAPKRLFRRGPVREAMTASVRRRYRVPVGVFASSRTVIATDANGDPIDIAFIDPNLTAAGDGSRDTPFMSVADFMAVPDVDRSLFDVIFVDARDDATDTNLNTTITLLDFQRLIGNGTLPSGDRPTISVFVQGEEIDIALPGTDGPLPFLTNSGAVGTDVVTLANGNEVAGFTIDAGGTANGITGTNIDGFRIHDNTIQNVVNGVLITSNTSADLNNPAEDRGVIRDNTILGYSDVTAPLPTNKGISITHADGILDLYVANNTVSRFDEDANGNGVLDPSEDINHNGVLDVGEDLDFDGILDQSEDVNTNGTLDRGSAIEVIANGGVINADDPTADIPTGIVNNTVSESGNGIIVQANNASEINLAFNDNTATDLTDEDGYGFGIIANQGTINLVSMANNTTDNSAGTGGALVLQNGGTINVANPDPDAIVFTNNIFQNSGADGFALVIDNSNLVLKDLSGFVFNNNGDDGLDLFVTNGGSLTVTNPIIGSTFNNNGDNGLEMNVSNGGQIDLLLGQLNDGGLTVSGNEFNNNGGSGVNATATSNGVILTTLVGNTATGNTENGAEFLADGGTIEMTGRSVTNGDVTVTSNGIRDNIFTGNTLNGMSISAANGGDFGTPFMSNNDFSDNTEAGLFIGGEGDTGIDGSIDLGAVTNNSFDRLNSGTTGILFDAHDVSITMGLTRNSFVGGNANTQFGIGGTVDGGGLNLTLNAANAANQNVFQDNVDAHIGLNLTGDSVNVVEIDRGFFDGAIDDTATPDFLGDGVAIHLNDTATLTGFVRRSIFTNNAGDGLRLVVVGNNDAGNNPTTSAAQINDFVIGGPLPSDGNLFQNNGRDGLNITRRERGQFRNILVENNVFDQNARNGAFIDSANSDQRGLLNGLPDLITMNSNAFTNNGANGIHFRIEADADLVANLDQNLIEDNAANGILVSENVDDEHDTRTITGVWTRNIIRGNTDDGINLKGNYGNELNDGIAGAGLVIGDITLNDVGTRSAMGNLITRNGQDGIDITQGGVLTIGNNIITFNGELAANPFAVAGINIDGPEYEDGDVFLNGSTIVTDDDIVFDRGFQDIRIVSNLISRNNGDGIEWLAEGGIDSANFAIESQLFVQNNEITQNEGRGIDLLLRAGDSDGTDSDNIDPDSVIQNIGVGGNFADVTIIGNHVKGNKQEGIYVVTTNSTSQSQSVASNVLPAEDGAVAPIVALRLDVHGNDIIGNGAEMVDFPASGLVIRVGSTDGAFGPFFDGGFATTGFNPEDLDGDGILDNDLNGDGYLNAADNLYGGVSASVTENFFDGNFGDDILVHGFRSTVDPITTGGTWTPDEFTINAYQSDPLARLDMIFTGNTFNSVELNNNDRTIVTGNEPGAFYNNAEGTFKSRTANQDAGGPFGNNADTRRRNAQRLASRYETNVLLPPAPGATPEPAPPFFLYPGMGDSTFRIRGGTNTFTDPSLGVVTLDQITMFDSPELSGDPNIVDAAFEAEGVVFTPNVLFGELPFGWGAF